MASFLRTKQAGMQKDLSAGILPGQFAPDEQARYGINSQVRYVPPLLPGADVFVCIKITVVILPFNS